jgi:hypothetical protein
MTTTQELYTEPFKKAQDTMMVAFDAWTHAFQQGADQLPGTLPVDPQQVIDQVFDFATLVLNAQRDFAKQLVGTSTTVAESLKNAK